MLVNGDMSVTRVDGRDARALRQVTFTRDFVRSSPGAVFIEWGRTRVLCTVAQEARVPPFLVGKGSGWLTAEYNMLPGASPQRVARESSTGRVNSRTREIQRLIGRSLRAVVDVAALGERTVYVDCDVIEADGGTRTAAITGAYVALVDAVRRWRADRLLPADPLLDSLAAVSVGIVDDQVLLDLCYTEDARAETDMNVVMTGRGGIVELQGTAEGRPFSRLQVEQMLDVAEGGIAALLRAQSDVLQGVVCTGERSSGEKP